jgi:type I site-specific restriction endonuclease
MRDPLVACIVCFVICISGFYLEDNLYQNRMAKEQVVVNVAKLISTLKNAKRHLESTTEFIDSLNLKAEEISRKTAPSQTRLNPKERANNVKKRNYFTQYSEQAQSVLNSLLEKYADAGVSELENLQTIKVYPFTEIG